MGYELDKEDHMILEALKKQTLNTLEISLIDLDSLLVKTIYSNKDTFTTTENLITLLKNGADMTVIPELFDFSALQLAAGDGELMFCLLQYAYCNYDEETKNKLRDHIDQDFIINDKKTNLFFYMFKRDFNNRQLKYKCYEIMIKLGCNSFNKIINGLPILLQTYKVSGEDYTQPLWNSNLMDWEQTFLYKYNTFNNNPVYLNINIPCFYILNSLYDKNSRIMQNIKQRYTMDELKTLYNKPLDKNGNTLLMYLMQHPTIIEAYLHKDKILDTIKILLEYGADPELKNKFNQTALSILKSNEDVIPSHRYTNLSYLLNKQEVVNSPKLQFPLFKKALMC